MTEAVCEADTFTEEREVCDSFVMDDSLFHSTVVTEWGLVCDGHQGQLMVDLGYTCFTVGVFFGVLVPGFFADRFGRKKMMFLTMLVSAVSTLASAFSPSYTFFLVTRVFTGFGTLGTFVTMCILAVEITSAKHKSLVGNLVHILWAPGQMVMALMAYFIRDWRTLHIAVSVPSKKNTFRVCFNSTSLFSSFHLTAAVPRHSGVSALASVSEQDRGGEQDHQADLQDTQEDRPRHLHEEQDRGEG